MTAPSKKTKGAAIAIFAATGSVVALSAGHVSIPISVVIAILGIGIGAGFACFQPSQMQRSEIDWATAHGVARS